MESNPKENSPEVHSQAIQPVRAIHPGSWHRTSILELAVAGAWMVLVTMALLWAGGLANADRLVRDLLVTANARSPHPDIVIVAIDDASLRGLGRWPWHRATLALALDRIESDKPKVIGLDILMGDRRSPGDATEDGLAEAIRRSGRVVLPVWAATSDADPLIKPLPELAAAAAALGHVNQPVDSDGMARYYDSHLRLEARTWVHFASAMRRVAGGSAVVPVDAVAAADEGQMPLAVTRQPIRQVSFMDVLKARLPSGTFTGKYVLIGVTADGLGQAYSLPEFGQPRLAPGVELIALALQDGLQGQALRDAPAWLDIVFSLLVLGAIALILGFVSPPRQLLALLVTVLLAVLGAYGLAAQFGLLTKPATSILVGVAAYLLWSWRKLDRVLGYLSRESKRIEGVWSLEPVGFESREASNVVDSRIDGLESAAIQLRRLHRFVSGLLLGLPDSSLVVDARGRIELANLEAARYFGHQAPACLIGLPFDGLMSDTLLPDKSRAAIGMAGMPAHGQMLNLEALGRNGRELLIRCVPFKQAAHSAENSWIVTMIDVCDLRCAERTRDEAFSFISHDMRSPQASILALLELRRLNKLQLPDGDFLKKIEDYARNALQLSEDFVFSARARTAPYSPQLVDLSDVCMNAVDDIWPQAQARQVVVQCVVPEEPAFCDGEVGLIRRALNNLLVNAINYSPAGGRVQCDLKAHDAWWVIAVRDNGPDVDPAQRAAIFNRVQQIESRKTSPGGVGFGLDFVRLVASRHGGAAGVDGQRGGGSVFTIRLRQAEVPGD
jgi:CHASE2 domain-containing sensor protein/signal transduction histidine kinase